MFCGCLSLLSLPEPSKWDTSNVKHSMDKLFERSSLNNLLDSSSEDSSDN